MPEPQSVSLGKDIHSPEVFVVQNNLEILFHVGRDSWIEHWKFHM